MTEFAFIKKFLYDINCEQYLEQFIDHQLLSADRVQYLDRDILIELGITKIADRIRILNKCRALKRMFYDNISFDVKEIINKINEFPTGSLLTNEELATDKHSVMFILNDGSARKVNVNGCFNADAIKKKLIRRLPLELITTSATGEKMYMSQNYDVFIVDYRKNVLHLLYDVELVTICHSNDRLEKNRLIFVSKDQTPSEESILTSRKIYLKTLNLTHKPTSSSFSNSQIPDTSVNEHSRDVANSENHPGKLRIENKKDNIRQIFNQRPPSELISTNLAEYFPNTDMKRLKNTLRKSVRLSVRQSMISGKPSNAKNNVGNIWLRSSNAMDKALLHNLNSGDCRDIDSSSRTKLKDDSTSNNRSLNDLSPLHSDNIQLESNENDRIELMNTDSESDGDKDDDIISLSTKVVAPKSWWKGARIGAGSFGSVYLGLNAQTGELMAVKQVELHPTTLTANSASSSEEGKQQNYNSNNGVKNMSHIHKMMIDALQHEMSLLKELHHENIVTYYGSSQENGNLNIFLEYVPGGSISSMLNNYGPFEEPLIISFTRQTLIGLSYLHKENIIHRDIKGANILIDIKGHVKITDFGISKKLSPLNSQQNKRASLQGSVYWMAPEVVKQIATTEKADIWSVGCVIIEMFTGEHPFPDFSQMQAIFKIGTNAIPEFPPWASDEAKEVLLKTFELDYIHRPSSLELLHYPWLTTTLL